jgi:hypothetical protein
MENHPLHKFVRGQKNQSSIEASVSGKNHPLQKFIHFVRVEWKNIIHPFWGCERGKSVRKRENRGLCVCVVFARQKSRYVSMAMVIRSSCNPAIITCCGCARLVEEEEEKYTRIEEGMLFLSQFFLCNGV